MRQIVLSLILLLAAGVALAERLIPGSALTAELKAGEDLVKLNGKVVSFAPGSRVFDLENRIVMRHALPARAKVAYTQDTYGNVLDLWLLSEGEIAKYKQLSLEQREAAKRNAQ